MSNSVTARWWLERKYPLEYGNAQRVLDSVKDDFEAEWMRKYEARLQANFDAAVESLLEK